MIQQYQYIQPQQAFQNEIELTISEGGVAQANHYEMPQAILSSLQLALCGGEMKTEIDWNFSVLRFCLRNELYGGQGGGGGGRRSENQKSIEIWRFLLRCDFVSFWIRFLFSLHFFQNLFCFRWDFVRNLFDFRCNFFYSAAKWKKKPEIDWNFQENELFLHINFLYLKLILINLNMDWFQYDILI